jgi:transcriptional regulator with XRE-family HTH domain
VQNTADLRVLVTLLRLLKDQSQTEMAAAAGLHRSALCRFETGKRSPGREDLAKLAEAAGLPMWAIDGILLPVVALARRLSSGADGLDVMGESLASISLEGLNGGILIRMAEFALDLGMDDDGYVATSAPDLSAAEDLWSLLSRPAGTGPAIDPKVRQELETLTARLCEESARMAAHSAAVSLDLARSALRVAEMVPLGTAGRPCCSGYAWAFIGNALRVAADLAGGEICFATAWRLWNEAEARSGSHLAEWRLLDLEASLRRDRRQFGHALELLERALEGAPAEARGRILLNKAFTLEQSGRIEDSLVVLREAAPLVETWGEPRERCVLHFNLLVILCHLDRFDEAEKGLAELHLLVEQLGNDLDKLRLRWLTARVWAGLGRREDACSAFEAVQRDFTERRIGYDAALVSLELAILYLQQNRPAEVQSLAREMAWIFDSHGVTREALAALTIFCEAVERNAVTVELARHVFGTLNRLRENAGFSASDIR